MVTTPPVPTHGNESTPASSKAPQPPVGSHLTGGVEGEAGSSCSTRRSREHRLPVASSSWIARMSYTPLADEFKRLANADGMGFLTVSTKRGDTYVWLIDAYVPGLLMAAQARGLSLGRAFNKLVKRRGYSSVKLTDN